VVCDRRILQSGCWHIRGARGDLAGDVHRGRAVARNGGGGGEERNQGIKEHYIMEFTSGVPWWLCRKNTWEIIYPGRKVVVATRFMLGALHEERASRNTVSVLILSSTAIHATLFKL
jgi:hypothetical protein